MATTAPTPETAERAHARIVAIAEEMGECLPELTALLHQRLAGDIAALQGDPLIRELLDESIQSNLDTFVRMLRLDLPLDDATAPPAAVEYARRLAQRGTSPNALLRSYRLGQATALTWALERIGHHEQERAVAVAAAVSFVETSFGYVDRVSEQVIAEYETERVRWLSHRTSVRVATLEEVLAGGRVDVDAAETGLGYRLRQHHLGAVLWRSPDGPTGDLRELERLVVQLAKAVGAQGAPLFVPRDTSTAWAWVPLGRSATIDDSALAGHADALRVAGAHLALGLVGAGVDGFLSTHDEARRAQELALVADQPTGPVTSWSEPDMRAATLLAADLHSTRRLVSSALGQLADDTESAARLRETLLVFLDEQGSYPATAAALHLHKNTVKYRIAKAVEARGRPLEDGRLDLELALIACKWMGSAVMAGTRVDR